VAAFATSCVQNNRHVPGPVERLDLSNELVAGY
jgi:hypothetical protein